jgi:spermidine/putrescine transport system substrate-binding protein
MKIILCALLMLLSIPYCYAQDKKEIVFYNWKDYTEKSVLEDFQKKSGIHVVLKEYTTRDMMFSEVQSEPEKFDVILATDVAVSLLKRYRLISEIDASKVSNTQYIKKKFCNLPIDPEKKYSVVGTLWSTVGLVINTNFVPANIDSWDVLWDEKYKGKIALFDDSREAIAVLLKYSNLSLNSTKPEELSIAKENARSLKENSVQFGDALGNVEKVMSGELWIAQAYNGDVLSAAKGRKDIVFILPKEGFTITVDFFVISVNCTKKEEAYKLINFFLEPENAARTASTFSYPTTVEAAAFIDKGDLSNPIIYPSQDVLQRGEFLVDVGEAENEYMKIFNSLKQK